MTGWAVTGPQETEATASGVSGHQVAYLALLWEENGKEPVEDWGEVVGGKARKRGWW